MAYVARTRQGTAKSAPSADRFTVDNSQVDWMIVRYIQDREAGNSHSRNKIHLQNKTSQDSLSPGTLVEQPSPEVCS
jgi:hypothetical protein